MTEIRPILSVNNKNISDCFRKERPILCLIEEKQLEQSDSKSLKLHNCRTDKVSANNTNNQKG